MPDPARGVPLSPLAVALRGYQVALDEFDETIAELLGVNRTDLRCLDLLSVAEPLTAGELAKASGLSSGAMTFVLDRLERGGFIERRRDASDRRKVLVEMIAEAHDRVFALHRPLVAEMRQSVGDFATAELEAIERFLSLGRELYQRHARRLRGLAEDEPLRSDTP